MATAALKLVQQAERRLEKSKQRNLKRLSNADHVRYLTVVALKTAKQPLSLWALEASMREALRFTVRSEYMLMALLQKRHETGIVLDPHSLKFGLASWVADNGNQRPQAHRTKAV